MRMHSCMHIWCQHVYTTPSLPLHREDPIHNFLHCAGFPILIIAFFGGHIHDLIPDIFSFTDYVKRRFGLVVTVCMF